MEKELVEDVAKAMQRQHAKEMLGAPQKWERLNKQERSTWRLIARSTIALIDERNGGTKRKPEAAPRQRAAQF